MLRKADCRQEWPPRHTRHSPPETDAEAPLWLSGAGGKPGQHWRHHLGRDRIGQKLGRQADGIHKDRARCSAPRRV